MLRYRVGSRLNATKDLVAAMSFIFKNADQFDVASKDYSLWGSSAGARMVAYIGSDGAAAFRGTVLSRPSIIVMAYTGYSDFSASDPPTFVTVCSDDRIVHVATVEKRVEQMRQFIRSTHHSCSYFSITP